MPNTLQEQANQIRAEIAFALGCEPATVSTVDGTWQITVPCDDDAVFIQLRVHGFSGVRCYALGNGMTRATFTNWPQGGVE